MGSFFKMRHSLLTTLWNSFCFCSIIHALHIFLYSWLCYRLSGEFISQFISSIRQQFVQLKWHGVVVLRISFKQRPTTSVTISLVIEVWDFPNTVLSRSVMEIRKKNASRFMRCKTQVASQLTESVSHFLLQFLLLSFCYWQYKRFG